MTQAKKKVSAAARAKTQHKQVTEQAGAVGHVVKAVPDYSLRTDLTSPMLSFVVYGVPAPQGSKAFKGYRGGKPILKEQSEGLDPWRAAVKTMGLKATRDWSSRTGKAWEPLDEPVMVSAVVTSKNSAAATKRGDIFAQGTPDLDKLQRAIGDALAPKPLPPGQFKGLPDKAKKQAREKAMEQQRRTCVLHDDSRIVAWDHVLKVYPNSTPDSLGFSGVTIRIWRMKDLHRLFERPVVSRGGVPHMKAADLRAWARPLSGRTWDEEAAVAWKDPRAVLEAPEEVTLAERGIDDDGVRTTLKVLALYGPDHYVPLSM